MKNNILKFIIYLYYLSLVFLVFIYLFPGSIISYLLYGDLVRQPNTIGDPMALLQPVLIIKKVLYLSSVQLGISINHFFFFFFLTFLGLTYNLSEKKFTNSFLFLFALSFLLELLHFFIPNRAFEIHDLLANIGGVVSVFYLLKLKKKFTS